MIITNKTKYAYSIDKNIFKLLDVGVYFNNNEMAIFLINEVFREKLNIIKK